MVSVFTEILVKYCSPCLLGHYISKLFKISVFVYQRNKCNFKYYQCITYLFVKCH